MRLTQRDLSLLLKLLTARYLTTFQILTLFWPQEPPHGGKNGTLKSCQRRLHQLTHHHLIRRIPQPIVRGDPPLPYIYALDKAGVRELQERLQIPVKARDWQPTGAERNHPFLQHLLALTDLQIALEKACALAGATLESWTDERELRSAGIDYVTLSGPAGGHEKEPVIPDALFQLRSGSKVGTFLVEADRQTLTVAPTLMERRGWRRKTQVYLAYAQSAQFGQRFAEGAVRILTVTRGAIRLTHMKETTEAVLAQADTHEGDVEFWFTTFVEALDPTRLLTQPIFQVAGSDEPGTLLA